MKQKWSPLYVLQLFLFLGPDLEHVWYNQWHCLNRLIFFLSYQQKLIANTPWLGVALCLLSLLIAGILDGLNLFSFVSAATFSGRSCIYQSCCMDSIVSLQKFNTLTLIFLLFLSHRSKSLEEKSLMKTHLTAGDTKSLTFSPQGTWGCLS